LTRSESEGAVDRLVAEQAALRRVAMFVARESSPQEVFGMVTEEAARVLGTVASAMLRFEPDETATLVAQSNTPWAPPPLGTRFELSGENVVTEVFRTGQPARADDWTSATGPVAAMADVLGVRSCVATPIRVGGRVWGALLAATDEADPLPPDTEVRILEFTELVATAIANAEARDEVATLAAEQSALLRVATLVAQGAPAGDIFSAVSDEVADLLGTTMAAINRFDPAEPAIIIVGAAEKTRARVPIGLRLELDDALVATQVYRTGRPAYVGPPATTSPSTPAAEFLGLIHRVSSVASPIFADGRLWGAIVVTSETELLPLDAQDRLEKFTNLVTTAIGNAETRAELTASRARIVAASDDARLRIERDLHDGAQQRLVSLGLELRTAAEGVPAELPELDARLGRVADEIDGVIDDLREMSRGIHPAVLSGSGLGPAIEMLAVRSTVPVKLDVESPGRFAPQVEVAAYYAVSEALTNTAKHANASQARVVAKALQDRLVVSIDDDGDGGAELREGSGLAGLRDRVEALGGFLRLSSPPSLGTTVAVELPLGSAALGTGGAGIDGDFSELVIGTDTSEAREAVLQQLLDEQAALRRVATLVARGARPGEIFAAVTNEVGDLFDSHQSAVMRFDTDAAAIEIVGVSEAIDDVAPIGTRWELHDSLASAHVFDTGRPARIDRADASLTDGPAAETTARLNLQSTVAVPIVVDGRLWGTVSVSSSGKQLAPDTDKRLEKFTELVATAIANANSRVALGGLAAEQAALRRIATLVADGSTTEELGAAVVEEVVRVLGVPSAWLLRYEGSWAVGVAGFNDPASEVGAHWKLDGPSVGASVLRTGAPARIDDYSTFQGTMADAARLHGYRSIVGVPIMVGGAVWGMIGAGVKGNEVELADDAEVRLQGFTALVATAIANAAARESLARLADELAASRRRIVAASDEARRQIERNLHDGVQQELVSASVALGTLEASLPGALELAQRLASVRGDLDVALATLVEIARGIHPAILAQGGLQAALETLTARSTVPVTLTTNLRRPVPDGVEVAAYYVVSESLTNVAKYARASAAKVDASTDEGALRLVVSDNGRGGAELGRGTGLIGLQDRVEALGGSLRIESPVGGGTSLEALFPIVSGTDRTT
jgi:signal transduction histidine kinase